MRNRRDACDWTGLQREWWWLSASRIPSFLTARSGKVFAFSGNDGTNGASAVVVQLDEDLTQVWCGFMWVAGSVGTTIANWNLHSGRL